MIVGCSFDRRTICRTRPPDRPKRAPISSQETTSPCFKAFAQFRLSRIMCRSSGQVSIRNVFGGELPHERRSGKTENEPRCQQSRTTPIMHGRDVRVRNFIPPGPPLTYGWAKSHRELLSRPIPSRFNFDDQIASSKSAAAFDVLGRLSARRRKKTRFGTFHWARHTNSHSGRRELGNVSLISRRALPPSQVFMSVATSRIHRTATALFGSS